MHEADKVEMNDLANDMCDRYVPLSVAAVEREKEAGGKVSGWAGMQKRRARMKKRSKLTHPTTQPFLSLILAYSVSPTCTAEAAMLRGKVARTTRPILHEADKPNPRPDTTRD